MKLFLFFDPLVDDTSFKRFVLQEVKLINIRTQIITTAKFAVELVPSAIILNADGTMERFDNVDIQQIEIIYNDFIQRISCSK